MYHFQGGHPGAAPSYQQPRPPQHTSYSPQPQAPSGQYPGFAAHQQTQKTLHGQYASAQQPQPPGVYSPSPPLPAPGAYTSSQQPHYQHHQAYSPNQAHTTGPIPQTAASQSSNQSCYNCGCSDHWAQNCPEPRRAVPAGALNGSRPLKRQKTTGPIITRYPPPPNHSSQRSLQRGFTHPPVGHQAFPIPQGPPTPLSTSGQSYNSWQPQQNPYVSQAPRQASQRWTSPSVPTPTSSYGPQHASPVSMNGNGQYQNYFNSLPQSAASQVSPLGTPVPLQSSTSFDSSPYPKPSISSSRPQSVASDRNQALEANGEKVESWLEELQALDFTEGKTGSGPIISHPANPVAQPLPADCAAADAIGRLPIAASLPPGVPVSMYFRNLDEKEFERNIKEKSEWSEVCNDPVFAEIASDCDAVSVSELIKKREDEALVLNGSDNEPEESDYGVDVHDQYSDDEQHLRERSYSERSVTPVEAKPPVSRTPSRTSNAERQQHPTCSIENEEVYAMAREPEDQGLSREQEERLAALGVSGLPKPVQPSMRRTVAATELPKALLASPVESVEGKSRSMSLDKRHTENGASPIPDSPSRDHSRELSQTEESPHPNVSTTRASPLPQFSRENSYQDRNGREPPTRYGSYDGRQPPPPPPPPPPPARRHSYFDRPPGLHSSPTDAHIQDSMTNGHDRSPAGEDADHFNDVLSPSKPRSITRKRSYRHSSEESDDGPKRQEEENAQRRKRKHPKVADAYSRRW